MGCPAGLEAKRCWAHFDLVPRPGKKPAKVPTARVNDPSGWLLYSEAVATMGRHAGLAVLLGDGLAGIDVDGCDKDPDKVEALLDQCKGAYVEPSISGGGLHILGAAPRLGFELDLRGTPHICTAWTTARFFVYLGTGRGSVARDLTGVVDRWAPAPAALPAAPVGDLRWQFDDERVVVHATLAANGDKFAQLYAAGNLEGFASQSEADCALASMLAFWCNSTEQIDRVFRTSALYRPKWEVNTYRNSTLRRAARFIQRVAPAGPRERADAPVVQRERLDAPVVAR